MQYPPDDPSAARADAARALLDALREVRDANERLQLAAAYVLEAFGDTTDAETVRMLLPGRSSGKPAVPPPARTTVADALTLLGDVDPKLSEPWASSDSVTVTERQPVGECPGCLTPSPARDVEGRCTECGWQL